MSREDARIIFAGLIHDGINANGLSAKARAEIEAALDKLIEVTNVGK